MTWSISFILSIPWWPSCICNRVLSCNSRGMRILILLVIIHHPQTAHLFKTSNVRLLLAFGVSGWANHWVLSDILCCGLGPFLALLLWCLIFCLKSRCDLCVDVFLWGGFPCGKGINSTSLPRPFLYLVYTV